MSLIIPFFAAFTVYGVASPYLSVLVRGLGYSTGLVGLLLGIFEVAGIAGPFLLGRLSDSRGRYKASLVLSSTLILAALYPLVAFRSPLFTILSLVVLAIGLKSMIPILDATATITLGAGGDYGRVRVVGSASFVLTALVLQYIPVLRPTGPKPIAIWIAITAGLFAISLTVLPEARGVKAGGVTRRSSRVSGREGPNPLTEPTFVLGLLIIALSRLAMAPITSFFSLYVVEALHWNAVGLMWAISASSEIPLMFVSARLVRRFGSPRILAAASVAIIVRLSIYALFPSPAGAVVGQLLHSLCYGLFHPAAVAFVATRVPPESRALGMTMYLSLGMGLPTFLGSSIGGWVVEWAGYRVLFASFTIFAAAALVLYLVTRERLEAPVRA